MESSKLDPLIPSSHDHPQSQPPTYIVLPFYPNHTRRSIFPWRKLFVFCVLILAVGATVYALWPCDPIVKISRLKLLHVRVHTRPHIALDVSLAATVRVHNLDFYSIKYNSLHVSVAYRDKELGHVVSGGGHVRARASSYVDATVEVSGVEVIKDLIYLLDDVAKGVIRFDTVTEVDGVVGFFFVRIPLKATISCEIDVGIKNQTVTHQNCYPQELGEDAAINDS